MYGVNYNYFGTGSGNSHEIKISYLPNPSSTIFAADATAEEGYGHLISNSSSWTAGNPYPRHNAGANILWADGHVSWMRVEEMLADKSLWKIIK